MTLGADLRRQLLLEGVERMRRAILEAVRGEGLEDPQPGEGDAAYTFAIECAVGAIEGIDVGAVIDSTENEE